MILSILDAKEKLESEGLHVSCNNAHSLWIAAHVRQVEGGMRLSEDACSLMWKSPHWVAVFPAKGLFTYEVSGSLSELVAVISTVYTDYLRQGGTLRDAFQRVVPDAEQHLMDRSPTPV